MPPWAAHNYGDTAAKARKFAGRSLFTLGSGLCTAGVAVAKAAAAGIQTLTSDHSDREKVTFARVAELTWSDPVTGSERRLPVALLGYATGFQLWSLEDRDGPAELVSTRRDGAVRWLEPVPEPRSEDPTDGPLLDTRPLLAVVPAPAPTDDTTAGPRQPSAAAQQQQQHRVQLYSLRTQGVVKTLSFGSEVLAVLCSSRVLVVALRGQLQAFDAATLEHTFSVLTYVAPPSRQQQQQQQHAAGAGGGERRVAQQHEGQDGVLGPLAGAACALGPRWLAYAADQAVQQSGCQARAQRLPVHRRDSSGSSTSRASSLPLPATSPGSMGSSVGSPGGALTSSAMAEAAREYAMKSGQHLAAGLAAAGSASYKYLSAQYQNWRSGAQQHTSAQQSDSAVAGTVMVRDVVTRAVVCHFRAHTSPLAAMHFTPDGTMLATASVAGHNINIFRIVPPAPGSGSGLLDCEGGGSGIGGGGGFGGPAAAPGYAVHLFRLHRGVTSALIQSITFAPDASWAAVTSGRGTCHVFRLARPQQPGAPARAASAPLDSLPAQQLGPAAWGAAAGLQRVGSGRGENGLQQQGRLEDGVMGQPVKLVALGRAGGKAGLLGSGIAGAATNAALSVYGQQTGVLPAAAAFLPGKPGSPRALSAPHHSYLPQDSSSGGALSLLVVSPEGLLTRHLLRAPSAEDGLRGGAAAAGHAPHINAHYPPNGTTTRDAAAAGDARAVAALQEDARWDICRQHGWQEREEMPATLLPSQAQPAVDVHSSSGALLGGSAPVSPRLSEHGAGSVGGEAGAAGVDPAWLAQAEGAPPRDPCAGPPLWADPQFRLLALPSQPRHLPLQQHQQQHQNQPPTLSHWSCDGMGNGTPLSASPGCLRLGAGAEYLNNFGAMAYARPGSSLSSASSAAAGAHWDSH